MQTIVWAPKLRLFETDDQTPAEGQPLAIFSVVWLDSVTGLLTSLLTNYSSSYLK